MPIVQSLMQSLRKQYGQEKGTRVYYAMAAKGKVRGEKLRKKAVHVKSYTRKRHGRATFGGRVCSHDKSGRAGATTLRLLERAYRNDFVDTLDASEQRLDELMEQGYLTNKHADPAYPKRKIYWGTEKALNLLRERGETHIGFRTHNKSGRMPLYNVRVPYVVNFDYVVDAKNSKEAIRRAREDKFGEHVQETGWNTEGKLDDVVTSESGVEVSRYTGKKTLAEIRSDIERDNRFASISGRAKSIKPYSPVARWWNEYPASLYGQREGLRTQNDLIKPRTYTRDDLMTRQRAIDRASAAAAVRRMAGVKAATGLDYASLTHTTIDPSRKIQIGPDLLFREQYRKGFGDKKQE